MVSTKKRDLRTLVLSFVLLVALNFSGSYWFTRFDFTAEKRFTLSPVSRKLMTGLNGKLDIIVYLEGDFPSGFKHLHNATKDLLNDLKAYSNGKLSFDFVNPSSGTAENKDELYKQLSSEGIEPLQVNVPKEGGMSQVLVLPAATISYHGRRISVSLLPAKSGQINNENLNNAAEDLEYAVTSGIKKVMADGKPLIGITEGHGELSDLQLYDAMNSLASGFDVRRVDLSVVPLEGLNRMKLLIVAKPDKPFTEAEKFKIDYFVMHGGRVLWTIDNVTAELDSLHKGGSELTLPKKLNLDDLLFNYGARVNYELIADMNCASIPVSSGQGQMQLARWLYYPIFDSHSTHPLMKNLSGIRSEFANTVDTIAIKGVSKQVILASSPYSRIALSPGIVSLQMISQEADPHAFKNVGLPVAVLLEGSFPSAFAGRPVPQGINTSGALMDRSLATKMIVIGDGDIFKNQVNVSDGSPFPLGFDRYSGQQYGNKSLLLNIADYMTDDSGLITLRNKDIKIRLLDRPRIRENKTFWQLINIFLPLVLLGIFALFQQTYRRRKFAKA